MMLCIMCALLFMNHCNDRKCVKADLSRFIFNVNRKMLIELKSEQKSLRVLLGLNWAFYTHVIVPIKASQIKA